MRKYFSTLVGKALETLDTIRSSREPLSLAELTLRTGLARTSLFRILHTLETTHHLERDERGRYRIPSPLRSAWPSPERDTLIRAAIPRMRELLCVVCETASVAMRFENHIEVVATCESHQRIRMTSMVGRVVAPHATALGKAIVSFQETARREWLLRSYGLHRLTVHTIVDEKRLVEELDQVRARGYSTDIEESVLDGCCFGAPIRDRRGQVIAAISISMPRMRLRDEALQCRLIEALRRTADATSTELEPSSRFTRL